MWFRVPTASDLGVSVPQGAQLSTQTCPLLLQGHHCKKTQRAAADHRSMLECNEKSRS